MIFLVRGRAHTQAWRRNDQMLEASLDGFVGKVAG